MSVIDDLNQVADDLDAIRRNSTVALRMLRRAQQAGSLEERKVALADAIRYVQANPVPGIQAPASLDVPALLSEADQIKARLEAARQTGEATK